MAGGSTSSTPLEHALDRQLGLLDDRLFQGNLGILLLQAGKQFGYSVHLHETAVVASTVACRAGNEGLLWQFTG